MSVKSYYQASLAGNMELDSRFDPMLTGPDDYIREEYRTNTGPPAFAARKLQESFPRPNILFPILLACHLQLLSPHSSPVS
jgi:hypothetical protein